MVYSYLHLGHSWGKEWLMFHGAYGTSFFQTSPRQNRRAPSMAQADMMKTWGLLRWAEVAKWLVTRLNDMGMGQN